MQWLIIIFQDLASIIHLNFHFPLMPRMYMSVQMEDRFPIIDILFFLTIPEGNNLSWDAKQIIDDLKKAGSDNMGSLIGMMK